MRLSAKVAAIAIATTGPAAAACKDSFVRVTLTHFDQIEYRVSDTLDGVGQNEASRRLANTLKSQGYEDVSRDDNVVIGWLNLSTSDRPSALRIVVSGSGNRTTFDAALTVPARRAASPERLRAGLCALIASAVK